MSHTTRASDRKTKMGIGSAISHTVQTKLSKEHFIAGDISDKIAIPLSDGKTTVFVKRLEDVERVRKFWENKINHLTYKP